MAVTHTLAGLQTELSAFQAAIVARDWDGAVDAAAGYDAVRLGIANQASADGGSASLPPEPRPSLYERITLAKVAAGGAGSVTQRRVHGRTNFRI